jgi:endoglucanase
VELEPISISLILSSGYAVPMKNSSVLLGLTLVLYACSGTHSSANTVTMGVAATPETGLESLATRAAKLNRTVNFGNMLEAPKEGDWGISLEERFFQLTKEGGFSAIRLPIRWNTHAAAAAPYTVDPVFFARIDWAVKQATARGLSIILDFHHYDELMAQPQQHRERFLGIWKQVAERYKNASSNVFFEVLNEPHGALEPFWNDYQKQAIAVIRKSNPTRALIVGPTGYNSAYKLSSLELPDDKNLIVTFHNYDPFRFTHQGAEWVEGATSWPKLEWTGTKVDLKARFQNWSWETQSSFALKAGKPSVSLEYARQWAGFYLHVADAPLTGYDKLRFRAAGTGKLGFTCSDRQDNWPPAYLLEVKAGQDYTVPFSSCGNPSKLLSLVVMNASDSVPALKISLEDVRLEGSGGTLTLLQSERDGVADLLNLAQNWGKAKGRPLFMGEFGAYSKADAASRARWTAAVREEAAKRGMSWGYWEFGAGFGVYDRTKNAWNRDLLKALIP